MGSDTSSGLFRIGFTFVIVARNWRLFEFALIVPWTVNIYGKINFWFYFTSILTLTFSID